MFALDDQWVWDSWIADDGDTFHLFFLQAPKALGDTGLRHSNATIGHASSADLHHWVYHGTALDRPAPGGWDAMAQWTGTTVRGDDGVWRMYYTGVTGRVYGVYDQRVGLAGSDDLRTWRRVGDRPILEADSRWYQTLAVDGSPGASETWRDPFVYRDPAGDGWHMLITARAAGAARLDDGVLAHARSADMINWEVGPPVSAPAGFGQIEVPQVRLIDRTPTLVFTCHPDEQTDARKEVGDYCTWSTTGGLLTGPFDLSAARPFVAEPDLFAAPLVRDRTGGWALVGFVNLEPKGVNAFEIIDPIPVHLGDGGLEAASSYRSVGAAILAGQPARG